MSQVVQLSEVTAERRGSALVADAAVSATTLTVEYAGDFDASGGLLDLNGTPLAYTLVTEGSLPDDPDVITLASPLPVAGATGDIIGAMDGGQVLTDYWAICSHEDGDEIMVPITDQQIPFYPIGIYNPPTPLLVSDDLLRLESAPGRTPTMDGTFIEPGTVPTDGTAPTSSPAPTVQGGIASLIVKWDPVDNKDAVTYEVHLSTTSGFTPDATTLSSETAGALAVIRKTIGGADLSYSTTYYVKLVAKDADGAAAPGSQGSGSPVQATSPDIATNAITANQIAANAVTVGKIDADAVTATTIAANAVTTAKIAANAVTATQIAADAVTALQIKSDAIDGKTVTGATIQTAASGNRWSIAGGAARSFIQGFTNDPAEANSGKLVADGGLSGVPALVVQGPSVTGMPAPPQMSLYSESATGKGTVRVTADALSLNGALATTGSGSVGPVEWDSSSVNLATNTKVTGGGATNVAAGSGFVSPPLSGMAETTFVAPKSGRVMISATAYVKPAADGQRLAICPEVRTGPTIRSGTVVYAANGDDAFANLNIQIIRGTSFIFVDGLTAGGTYNAYIGVERSTGGTGTNVSNTSLRVTPLV